MKSIREKQIKDYRELRIVRLQNIRIYSYYKLSIVQLNFKNHVTTNGIVIRHSESSNFYYRFLKIISF